MPRPDRERARRALACGTERGLGDPWRRARHARVPSGPTQRGGARRPPRVRGDAARPLDLDVRAYRPRRLVRLGRVALRGVEVAAFLRRAAEAHEDVAELRARAERAVRCRDLAQPTLPRRDVAVAYVQLGEAPPPARVRS